MAVIFNTIKNILSVSFPIIVARCAGALNSIATLIIIKEIGYDQLAASSIINSIIASIMVSIWSFNYSVTILVGYYMNKTTEIGEILRKSLLLSALISLPVIIFLLNLSKILVLFKINDRVIFFSQEFFDGYVLCVIPSMWNMIFSQLLVGISKYKMTAIYNAIFTAFVIMFSYILALGRFGITAMGIKGIGYANFFAFSLIDILLLGYLAGEQFSKYDFFNRNGIRKISNKYWKQLINIGTPICFFTFMESITAPIIALMIAQLGNDMLVCQQIAMQTIIVPFMITFGLAQTCMTLVSKETNQLNICNIVNISLIMGTLSDILFLIIVWICFNKIVSFYAEGSYNNHLLVNVIVLVSIKNIFDGIRNILTYSLTSLGDNRTTVFINVVLGNTMSILASYLMMREHGIAGIYGSFILCYLINSIILKYRLNKTLSTQPSHIRKTIR